MDKTVYQGLYLRMRKDQYKMLKDRSQRQGVPLASLIRIAVDEYLGVDY